MAVFQNETGYCFPGETIFSKGCVKAVTFLCKLRTVKSLKVGKDGSVTKSVSISDFTKALGLLPNFMLDSHRPE